jgi:long-chain fatty acid transport protein
MPLVVKLNMRQLLRAVLVLAFCGSSAPAWAQGYGLYEQGACAMGRTGAGVAAPCDDGSAIFFNPAALTASPSVVSGGATAIAPRGHFTNDTTSRVSTLNDRTFGVPAAYFAYPITPRAVVGFGVFAPYGLTSDWPNDSEGRFLGYLSSVKAAYFQPTAAFKLSDRFSVGGGLDITYSTVELRRRLDLAPVPLPGAPNLTFQALGVPPGTDFGDIRLTGNGTGFGVHLGAIVKANDKLSFGARYLSRQHIDYNNGDLATAQVPTNLRTPVPLPGIPAGTPIDALLAPQFQAGATLGAQSASTTLPFPDQFVVGAAIRPNAQFALFADYQFTNWSLLDQIVIDNERAPTTTLVQSFDNTHGIRLGAEYTLGGGTIIRGGFDAHGAGAPDQTVTPLLPEASRREVAVGVGIPIQRARLDVAYQFINQADRRGRTTDGGLAVPTAAVNNGLYQYHANLFGASFVYRF